ncbi:protein starmaker [Monomorium pharaonis]|uniref:protein starmaker n=1 Tax=Monomorium pharaonis TaxID=307658 RepID=UPI00063EED7B|nr:protein starmaker [Monomorium pharaonis]XP_012526289.1 protein starmaker [Monomorium pharaonis]XP_036144646.1 protein starmaker [Monomorium pharaonis]XP_036144647.1 protein starmaker [Monomorium pharaonis]XP_036144648.1 protein starmaker [Monomorium pharaonis]XP_036144649.1 protein starmaker [Monomorium pharaonis]XP_036144650.1 protein starmaker [Monomorium pharaonis]XP_036144651.1 protein starmaker [Monomorium pharaonis]
MTAMESDSESQDSDDGRRFRFEATRKDSVAPVITADRTRTPKRNKLSQHDKSYRDRKERSKYESSSKTTDDKDLRHSTKHSKHDSRNSKQEDNKNSHRESRSGFATNGRGGSRNSSGGDARERSRGDLKRQSDRDRSIHRPQRSREHSHERNHHDERASSDKHRGSRYHERHKHHSRDRSRDRSYQSSRVKPDDHRSRDDHGRHDSSRKRLSKENRLQNPRDYSSPKNVERERSHSETRSSENTKKDSSIEAQDGKDLDLSQFDVLSETDENMSDDRDSEDRTSSPHLCDMKTRDFEIRSESRAIKRKNDDVAGDRKREELKVKRRSYDLASSSSNNNPSAVSDSLHSAATFLVTRETCMDSEREKSEYCEEERLLVRDSNFECSSSGEKYLCSDASNEIRSEKNMDQTVRTYGPLLPPEFSSDDNKLDSEMFHENKINDDTDGKSMNFIGPCLPPRLNDRQSIEREDATDAPTTAEAVFGPALPPHLLQREQKNDSRDRIIGPVLPTDCGISESRGDSTAYPESDDDSAIGPLPADHPALRTSHVHEQLDLRAQRIRNEKYSEEIDDGNKREEWMTELPPAQAVNLGLGPRKFRLRDGPDMSDRSCWTDTPAKKAWKQRDSESKRQSEKKHINEFHKKDTDKNRKCEKSLLEMHQSKIAKKKKKEEKEAKQTGISTRRPFDRDIDLQVNRFDQVQKKTVLMKAQLLDDRFSRGQI